MEKKIQKVYIDEGFGFKIRLLNVPMVKIRGEWTPKIDYNGLAQVVLMKLCDKGSRLTGVEVRFIRQQLDMTLQAFADRFCVSHAAVIKWEKSKSKPTAMAWSTEKDLRLFVLSKLVDKADEIVKLYADLEKEPANSVTLLEIDARKMAV